VQHRLKRYRIGLARRDSNSIKLGDVGGPDFLARAVAVMKHLKVKQVFRCFTLYKLGPER
jgi:hypothetical protein